MDGLVQTMSGPNYDSEEVEHALAGKLAPYHSAFVLAQEVRRLRGEYERLAEAAQNVVDDLQTAVDEGSTVERLRTMVGIIGRCLERALPAACTCDRSAAVVLNGTCPLHSEEAPAPVAAPPTHDAAECGHLAGRELTAGELGLAPPDHK